MTPELKKQFWKALPFSRPVDELQSGRTGRAPGVEMSLLNAAHAIATFGRVHPGRGCTRLCRLLQGDAKDEGARLGC
jgi:hypothetical protein